jgi:Tfp pilus assembly protein PilN
MKSINLLPGKPKRERSISYITILVVIAVAILALVLQTSLYLLWSKNQDELEQKISSYDAQIIKLKEEGQSRDLIDTFHFASSTLAQLKEQRPEYIPYLAAVIGYLPSSAKVVFIEASEKDKLEMQFYFKSYAESVSYLEKLEASPQLGNVQFGSYTNKIEDNHAAGNNTTVFEMMLQVSFAESKGVSE